MRWTGVFTSWPFRRRLIALLLLFFLPAFVIMAASWIRESREDVRDAQARALVLVESLAAQQEQIATSTKMLLSTLAQLPEVQRRDAAACSRLFRELRTRYPLYSVIGAVAPDGNLFATSSSLPAGFTNLADRKHVQEAIRTRDFAASEYVVGRTTDVPSLFYAFPVVDAQHRLTAVVTAGFRLEEYGRFIKKADLGPADIVTIADWAGVRVYRVPANEGAASGIRLPAATIRRITGEAAKGLYEITGQDGIDRFYAFRQVRLDDRPGAPYLYMIAGIAKAPILAHANWLLLTNMGTLGIAACLALAVAWGVGHLGFVRPTNQLVAATERLAQGDLTTRTGLPHTTDELGRLAAAFDNMAGLLEVRSRDRTRAEAALAAANAELEQRVQERTQALSDVNMTLVAENAERERADAALRTRTGQLEAVREVSIELTRELDLTRLLRLIVERAARLMSATSGTCFLLDESGECLVPKAWIGYDEWRAATPHSLSQGLAGQVAQRREGVVTTNYPAEPFADRRVLERKKITAVMGEPLLYRQQLIGVLTLDYENERGDFTPEERDLLRVFATQAAIAIENARLYAAAQQALADLQAAQAGLIRSEQLRGLGQMAAGIAHDLNNTLAAVLGQVELANLCAPSPALREALQCIETAATDGATVVRRLQEFARPRGTSQLAPCDLAAVVRETVELTRPRWQDEPQRRGATIAVDVALGDLPPIQGNPSELREAITNLVFNATDAMPDGGTLSFQASASADAVVLAVADSGVGMTPEVQARIFEPFFTTKGVRGNGLGLAVVYGIMGRHGGKINVASTPGQGTTFTLTFQRASAPATAASASARSEPARRKRLLVVDDEALVRRTLSALLRSVGHDVVEASDGPAALTLLATAPVDAVITDLGMPGMAGWELATRVKSHDPGLPVVLLTGWQEPGGGDAAAPDSVDAVLGKPVKLRDLERILEELCSRGASPFRDAPPAERPE